MELSIIIPAYNAAKTLEKCVKIVRKEAKKCTNSYEIVIAEDGSSDGTDRIATRIAKENKDVRHLHNDEKLGRGLALTKAFKTVRSKYSLYIDADLDISPGYIKDFVAAFRKGYDVVSVSKRHPLSITKTTFARNILSKGYHKLIRIIFRSKIYDHQGGMKGMDQKTIRKILPLVEDRHWFWDTELVILAQWANLRILEIPIKSVYGIENSTVRNWRDTIEMGKAIVKLLARERRVRRRIRESLR